MATCKSCGRSVSWWQRRPGGLCLDCSDALISREREHLIGSLGQAPIHCHWAIPDVLIKPSREGVAVGDLFITAGGLVYIPYARWYDMGQLGLALRRFAGGPSVATTILMPYTSIEETRKMANAQMDALTVRQESFGMSIEDRMRSFDATVIPKKNIQGIDLNASENIITITHTCISSPDSTEPSPSAKLSLAMTSVGDVYQYLQEWFAGSAEDKHDTQGSNLRLPRAYQLLENIRADNIPEVITPKTLSEIAEIETYTQALCKGLMKKKWPVRADLAEKIKRVSATLAQKIRLQLQQNIKPNRRSLIIRGVIFACLFLFFCWGLINLPMETKSEYALFAGILGVILLIAGCALHFSWIRYKRLKTVLSALMPS